MQTKPTIPQGTRDFDAATVRKRNFIFTTIKNVFELYGYEPLETPAMENLTTLMGKYGDEGDKLIFKILNNGLNDEKNIAKARAGFEEIITGKNSIDITERALRYDLTIPFARYVAKNNMELAMPFKRYQMQPVWRADRPQKGRYREFYQCDADVVGSPSLLNEAELAMIYHEAFTKLGLEGYVLKINSRKILAALAIACNAASNMTAITVAIDKLDKVGLEKVKTELADRGLNKEQIKIIETYLTISGSNDEKIVAIEKLLGNINEGKKGIDEIKFVLNNCKDADINLQVDFTLARGLNYYTGIIYEAKAPAQVNMGSIGGGGRYDNLTELFGVNGITGVGISFGVDRIYDVMEELNLFKDATQSSCKVVFFNMGETEAVYSFEWIKKLRAANISCELYPENVKIDKQIKYALKKQVPYAVIIGSKEMDEQTCVVKNLQANTQETMKIEELISYLHKLQ